MNTQRIYRKIHKRQDDKTNRFLFFGDIIKRARIERGLTQENVCLGITSDSYYSKVENNKLNPNDYFIEEIGNRLDINFQRFYPGLDKENIFDRLIQGVFYSDAEALRALHDEVSDLKHALIQDLVTLAVSVIENDYRRVEKITKQLEPLVNTMPDESVSLFLVFSAIGYYQQSNYRTCIELMMTCALISDVKEELRTLEQLYLYLSKQKLDLKASSMAHYNQAHARLMTFHHRDRLLDLNLYHTLFIALESPLEATKVIEKIHARNVPDYLRNLYNYLKAMIAKQAGDEEGAMNHLLEIDETLKDSWFYKGLIMRTRILKNRKACTKSLHVYFDDDVTSPSMLLQKVAFTVLTTENSKTLKKYLNDVALPFAIEKQDIMAIREFTEALVSISVSNARYKDALAYSKRQDCAIAKIQQIIRNTSVSNRS